MIDTHSHIDGPEFSDDLDLVISRAREAGIEKVFVPAICRADLPRILDVCRSYPDYLYPMIGLHPENVNDEDPDEALRLMEEQLSQSINNPAAPHFIAVGEVGLDLYWDDTYRELQLRVFEQQIQWAVRYNLPLMIHCRKAHNELLRLIRQYSGSRLTGVFHCFTGRPEQARELLNYPGICLGIGGELT
ncbi:MAG: TatD family hydrolase, partial [Bacteroidaceae bacterium]|nr:TatD family hydrolase [Bacteroidaceae bacterium]